MGESADEGGDTVQRIVPSLWFDKEAEEAMNFYVSTFNESVSGSKETEGSSIVEITHYERGMEAPGTERMLGRVINGIFELRGHRFYALDGGPIFKFNPSVSFILNFDPSRETDARGSLDQLWDRLSTGGVALMPLQEYPFSKRYGWIQDKYGLSWQLILTNPEGEERPFIVPSLLFVGAVSGRAEEAVNFYLSVFENARRGTIARYPKGMEPEKEGTTMFSDFVLENQWLAAMDSAREHNFAFNEAISFLVNCDTQQEIDRYWERLSAVPAAEQCGWLKDKYGLSWQIAPPAIRASPGALG
jgi:predicted 3-demethylubiquinone-9 3-methyltransferase (glyoxalase superfamily)